MATTDVTITSSLGQAIGATITLQVGAIPAASVDLRPGGGTKITGGGSFPDIDSRRRNGQESVDISVKVRTGSGASASRKFSFKGILDGYSISNVVGNNSYQAVIKNNAQCLLELTTLMPGLTPNSINIYKIPSAALKTSAQGEDNESIKGWTKLVQDNPKLLSLPPIKFYVELLKLIVEKQQGGWQNYLGKEKLVSGQQAFKDIFESEQYKKSLSNAKKVLENIKYDGCSGLINNLKMASPAGIGTMELFTQGPTILLESLLNFLSSVGCSIIFSDSANYIVPINSVIKQDPYTPGVGQLSTSVNCAGPADYTSYTFNDVGFRDVNSVILLSPKYAGGTHLANTTSDSGIIGCFAAPAGEAKGSGVYVTRAHPWMATSARAPSAGDSKKGKGDLDGAESPYKEKKSFKDAAQATAKPTAERLAEKDSQTQKIGEAFKNFAETKYYQARFTDRQGSITLDFNPDWAPGTGGVLFVRESGMYLHFYVTSVTHRVDTSAPASGSAITIVNFCCGRFGKSPAGSDGDEFLGYNAGTEKTIRAGYVAGFK